jgi:SAM-dependent methyltransferase
VSHAGVVLRREPPERLDVATRIPKSKEECEHHARYVWASSLVSGDVLDVACGTGYGARQLARRARVAGVDRDAQAIGLARSRVAGRFLVADVPPLPFPSDAFDFVVCFEAIEHIADDVGLVREISRVLHPNGELLISTPNKDVSATSRNPPNRWHVREYTPAALLGVLEHGGLRSCEVYMQSFPPVFSRGHRIAWRCQGVAWGLPAWVRSLARPVLGDADVRPFGGQEKPGYWVIRAKRR